VLRLASDPVKGTLWVCTAAAIFEVVVTDEDRDVWEHYLTEGQFELALQYAKVQTVSLSICVCARGAGPRGCLHPLCGALTLWVGGWAGTAPGVPRAQNAAQKDKVYGAQADWYYGQGRYQLAAKYYALTQKSFEEITLKLIRKVLSPLPRAPCHPPPRHGLAAGSHRGHWARGARI
jgi:vacuolar protein sorting-associated protein 18